MPLAQLCRQQPDKPGVLQARPVASSSPESPSPVQDGALAAASTDVARLLASMQPGAAEAQPAAGSPVAQRCLDGEAAPGTGGQAAPGGTGEGSPAATAAAASALPVQPDAHGSALPLADLPSAAVPLPLPEPQQESLPRSAAAAAPAAAPALQQPAEAQPGQRPSSTGQQAAEPASSMRRSPQSSQGSARTKRTAAAAASPCRAKPQRADAAPLQQSQTSRSQLPSALSPPIAAAEPQQQQGQLPAEAVRPDVAPEPQRAGQLGADAGPAGTSGVLADPAEAEPAQAEPPAKRHKPSSSVQPGRPAALVGWSQDSKRTEPIKISILEARGSTQEQRPAHAAPSVGADAPQLAATPGPAGLLASQHAASQVPVGSCVEAAPAQPCQPADGPPMAKAHPPETAADQPAACHTLADRPEGQRAGGSLRAVHAAHPQQPCEPIAQPSAAPLADAGARSIPIIRAQQAATLQSQQQQQQPTNSQVQVKRSTSCGAAAGFGCWC